MLAITNKENLKEGAIAILTALAFIFFSGTVAFAQPNYDFDGDGKADIATMGFDDYEWWHLRSSDDGNGAVQFGDPNLKSDFPVPADYTGDGLTDVAFARLNTNEWFILRSEDQSFYSFSFGDFRGQDDVPTSGDFDGDGIADPTVYRTTSGTWYIRQSSNGQVRIEQFGRDEEDVPVVADYDGDGKDDIAIHRHSTGEWWLNQSTAGVVVHRFTSPFNNLGGGPQMAFTPGDYTGDGKADVAFFEGLTGTWYVLRSENPSSFYSFPFGAFGDLAAMADYDGDGKMDAAVYRESENLFYILQSTDGFRAVPFGTSNDIPLPLFRTGLGF